MNVLNFVSGGILLLQPLLTVAQAFLATHHHGFKESPVFGPWHIFGAGEEAEEDKEDDKSEASAAASDPSLLDDQPPPGYQTPTCACLSVCCCSAARYVQKCMTMLAPIVSEHMLLELSVTPSIRGTRQGQLEGIQEEEEAHGRE
jgi:hypothetical protein